VSIKSKGLGDDVEKITKATGIKSFVDKVNKLLGKDCDCKERKKKLNKLFPYKKYFPTDNLDPKK
jgi:hypothetical protein|tara:strand:+ start:491 stop:685 length:195 start_codon:yes stop_codon:yes gene_type:complete